MRRTCTSPVENLAWALCVTVDFVEARSDLGWVLILGGFDAGVGLGVRGGAQKASAVSNGWS